MTAKRVVVVDTDIVRRALLECALPPGSEVAFVERIDDIADADVAVVGSAAGSSVGEICQALRGRMAVVLADERYSDASVAQRETAAWGAGFVAPPFGREELSQAIDAALTRSSDVPVGVKGADGVAPTGVPADGEPSWNPGADSPERMWDQFRDRVDTIYRNLDRLDHYQVLEISPQSTAQQIKVAYQMRVMEFHPDRFAAHPNEDFRRKLYEITKAVTEAFRVLSDPDRRTTYDAERRPRDRTAARRPRGRRPGGTGST
jgi:hypothetical protein